MSSVWIKNENNYKLVWYCTITTIFQLTYGYLVGWYFMLEPTLIIQLHGEAPNDR